MLTTRTRHTDILKKNTSYLNVKKCKNEKYNVYVSYIISTILKRL